MTRITKPDSSEKPSQKFTMQSFSRGAIAAGYSRVLIETGSSPSQHLVPSRGDLRPAELARPGDALRRELVASCGIEIGRAWCRERGSLWRGVVEAEITRWKLG